MTQLQLCSELKRMTFSELLQQDQPLPHVVRDWGLPQDRNSDRNSLRTETLCLADIPMFPTKLLLAFRTQTFEVFHHFVILAIARILTSLPPPLYGKPWC